LVSRQWKWILTFPDTIKKHCTAKLISKGATSLDLCTAITSYMLIESIDEQKALEHFLNCRTECLKSCLSSDGENLSKMIEFVKELKLSLFHCFWIFFFECNKNEGKFSQQIISKMIYDWFMKSSKDFETALAEITTKLTLSAQQTYNLYESLIKVINNDSIFTQIETPTLQYFSKLTSLSQRDKKYTTEKKQIGWDLLYQQLLQKNTSYEKIEEMGNLESGNFIWNVFFEKFFFERVSKIIKFSFQSLTWKNFSSSRSVQSFESNVSSSIWDNLSKDSNFSSKMDLKRGIIDQQFTKISPNVLPLLISFEEFLDSVMDDFSSIGFH
jgi:hypothetical protein